MGDSGGGFQASTGLLTPQPPGSGGLKTNRRKARNAAIQNHSD